MACLICAITVHDDEESQNQVANGNSLLSLESTSKSNNSYFPLAAIPIPDAVEAAAFCFNIVQSNT